MNEDYLKQAGCTLTSQGEKEQNHQHEDLGGEETKERQGPHSVFSKTGFLRRGLGRVGVESLSFLTAAQRGVLLIYPAWIFGSGSHASHSKSGGIEGNKMEKGKGMK